MHDFFVSMMLLGAFSADQSVSPYWMEANQYGVMPRSRGALALVQAGTTFDTSKTFQWKWGLSVGALSDSRTWNPELPKVRPVADEAFVAVKWKCLGLEGGMARRTQDFLAPGDGAGTSAFNLGTLSTTGGNMIFSGNAPTMPGYTARLYPVAIPGTKDHLRFMGRFGDYWTIDNRYVKGAMVHNTALGMQIGLNRKNTLSFTLALDHYSMWGGTSPELGKLPSDFRNYCRMLVGSSAPAGGGYSDGDVVNVLGNHIGHYLLRLDYKGRGWNLVLQHDHPYEDKGGMKLKNAPDGVNTVAFSFTDKDRWVSDIVYEFQLTRWQGGTCERRPATEAEVAEHKDPRLYQEPDGSWSLVTGGADDYFWNYEYKSGWTHDGLVLGNPLISLDNNRLVAHHVGVGGKLFRKIPYRFLLTWSRNLGRYREPWQGRDAFWGLPYKKTLSPEVHQVSGGFQCEIPLAKKRLFIVPAIWWDCGSLRPDGNVGGTVALRYYFVRL